MTDGRPPSNDSTCPCPRDHAIVVGIDKYDQPIASLQGSMNDSRLFKEWLERPDGGGLDPKNIVHMQGLGNGRPISNDIEDELLRFIDRSYVEGRPVGRRLYIYMAGHGVIPTFPYQNDCGLVMANARPNLLRAIPGRFAAEVVEKSALFEEVVLFMDCCREVNGAANIQFGLQLGMDPTVQPPPVLFAFASQWASTAAERLLPHPLDPKSPQLTQGIFTHVLLRGLTSAIDDNGRVTSASLSDFVRREVQSLLQPDDRRRPDFFFDVNRPLIDFGAGLPLDVELKPSKRGKKFELLNGDLTPIRPTFVHSSGAKKYRLFPGLYAIDLNGTSQQPLRVIEGPLHVTV